MFSVNCSQPLTSDTSYMDDYQPLIEKPKLFDIEKALEIEGLK